MRREASFDHRGDRSESCDGRRKGSFGGERESIGGDLRRRESSGGDMRRESSGGDRRRRESSGGDNRRRESRRESHGGDRRSRSRRDSPRDRRDSVGGGGRREQSGVPSFKESFSSTPPRVGCRGERVAPPPPSSFASSEDCGKMSYREWRKRKELERTASR